MIVTRLRALTASMLLKRELSRTNAFFVAPTVASPAAPPMLPYPMRTWAFFALATRARRIRAPAAFHLATAVCRLQSHFAGSPS